MDAANPGPYLYTIVALTALVALLLGLLAFAIWRFSAAARGARRPLREERPSEQAVVRALLGEAPITGRMPVSIPGLAKVGDGIQLPQQQQLRPREKK